MIKAARQTCIGGFADSHSADCPTSTQRCGGCTKSGFLRYRISVCWIWVREVAPQCRYGFPSGQASTCACDLSASSLAHLEEKVAEVRVIQDDFLNSDFPVTSADVVYAHSVLHHFKHLGPALDKLRAVLQPDGVAVTHDPLITWPPYRWLRKALGTFKSDSAWEHPWRWQDLEAISTRFDVAHIQGLLGASKWGLLLTWAAETLHERDLRQATDLSSVGHCLRVAMCFHA